MSEYIVKRDGAQDLQLNGRILAEVSGRREGSKKWTELRIYQTSGGRYVFARDRYSELPGEKTIHEALTVETAEDLIRALHDDSGVLGRISKEALEAAGAMDPQIQVRLDADAGELIRCFLEYSDGDFVQEIMREPLPEVVGRKVVRGVPAMGTFSPGHAAPSGTPYYKEVQLRLQRPKVGTGFARYVESNLEDELNAGNPGGPITETPDDHR